LTPASDIKDVESPCNSEFINPLPDSVTSSWLLNILPKRRFCILFARLVHKFSRFLAQTFYMTSLPSYSQVPSHENYDQDLADDFKYGVSVSEAILSIRMAFIRKVYSILSLQLGFTAALTVFYAYSDYAKNIVLNPTLFFSTVIFTFITLFALIYYRRETPKNYILISIFTILQGHTVATTSCFYDPEVVLQALLLTFGIFVGLTLFTFQSRIDFSGYRTYLFAGLWGLILYSFLSIWFPPSSFTNSLIVGFSALLFCGFIIVDTQDIMARLSPEEYIVASVELYLDVVNLFISILQLLDNRSRD
jgi:FtsH-binding integral membrane protein